jgi:hypothetical protein
MAKNRGERMVGLVPKQTRGERRELRRAVRKVTKLTREGLEGEEGWGFVVVVAKAVGPDGEAWDHGIIMGGTNFVYDSDVRDLLEATLATWPKDGQGG